VADTDIATVVDSLVADHQARNTGGEQP
jgi:hypothetical protein